LKVEYEIVLRTLGVFHIGLGWEV